MNDGQILALLPAFRPAADALQRSLTSLLEQTLQIDVLVIDDGSEPPIKQLLSQHPRVRVLALPHNGGITRALRAGVEFGLEQGYEFFCRLDVGDIAWPDRARRQLDTMRSRPELDLLGSLARVVTPDGKELFTHGVSGGPAAIKGYLWLNSPFKHSTFFIRASSMARFGNYDDAFPVAQDYERLLSFSRRGVVDCLNEPLIDYVDDPAGISSRRRNLQLRMRLKAQLKYADLTAPRWYVGLFRTLGLLIAPKQLAKMLSCWHWRKGA